MYNLFSVDEMAGLFDLVEHLADIVTPLVESLIGLFLNTDLTLLEDYDALHPVNFGLHASLLDDHIAKFLLSEIDTDACELCETLQSYALVVGLDYADVVLDQLTEEVLHMQGCMLCAQQEWRVDGYLLLDLVGVEGQELHC